MNGTRQRNAGQTGTSWDEGWDKDSAWNESPVGIQALLLGAPGLIPYAEWRLHTGGHTYTHTHALTHAVTRFGTHAPPPPPHTHTLTDTLAHEVMGDTRTT